MVHITQVAEMLCGWAMWSEWNEFVGGDYKC